MKLACPACAGTLRPTRKLYAVWVLQFEFWRPTVRRFYLCPRCSRLAFKGTEAGQRAVRALLDCAAGQIGGGGA